MPRPAPDELEALQSRLLEAVLTRAPLDSGAAPLQFPDLELVLRHPTVYVLDENVGKALRIDAPQPVRVVSRDELRAVAREQGDVPYFAFGPPEPRDEAVRLTLEAKLASAEARPELGLSAVQVTFARTAAGWEVAEPPTFLAS